MDYRIELPSQEFLLDKFQYHPDGYLMRRKKWGKYQPLEKVGYKNKYGYIVCKVGVKSFYVHRLIWMLLHGDLCGKDIDHINGDRSDNRIENLRLVSKLQNNRNIRKAKKNSKTGLLGASLHKSSGKFVAQIQNNGKYEVIGFFETAKEAHYAYVMRKREIHETCTI